MSLSAEQPNKGPLPDTLVAPDTLREIVRIEREYRRLAFDELRTQLDEIETKPNFFNGQLGRIWMHTSSVWRTVLVSTFEADGQAASRIIINDTSGQGLQKTVHVEDHVLLKQRNLIGSTMFDGTHNGVAGQWIDNLGAAPLLVPSQSGCRVIEGIGYEPPVPAPQSQTEYGIGVLDIRETVENLVAVVYKLNHL
jgi:hypothetical protein